MDVPSEQEVSEAIEAANASLIAQYALSLEYERQRLSAELPGKIEIYGNAKRDLDVCKAAVKHFSSTISMLQSVLKSLKPY